MENVDLEDSEDESGAETRDEDEDDSSDGSDISHSDLEIKVNQIMNNVFGDCGFDEESDTNASTHL